MNTTGSTFTETENIQTYQFVPGLFYEIHQYDYTHIPPLFFVDGEYCKMKNGKLVLQNFCTIHPLKNHKIYVNGSIDDDWYKNKYDGVYVYRIIHDDLLHYGTFKTFSIERVCSKDRLNRYVKFDELKFLGKQVESINSSLPKTFFGNSRCISVNTLNEMITVLHNDKAKIN